MSSRRIWPVVVAALVAVVMAVTFVPLSSAAAQSSEDGGFEFDRDDRGGRWGVDDRPVDGGDAPEPDEEPESEPAPEQEPESETQTEQVEDDTTAASSEPDTTDGSDVVDDEATADGEAAGEGSDVVAEGATTESASGVAQSSDGRSWLPVFGLFGFLALGSLAFFAARRNRRESDKLASTQVIRATPTARTADKVDWNVKVPDPIPTPVPEPAPVQAEPTAGLLADAPPPAGAAARLDAPPPQADTPTIEAPVPAAPLPEVPAPHVAAPEVEAPEPPAPHDVSTGPAMTLPEAPTGIVFHEPPASQPPTPEPTTAPGQGEIDVAKRLSSAGQAPQVVLPDFPAMTPALAPTPLPDLPTMEVPQTAADVADPDSDETPTIESSAGVVADTAIETPPTIESPQVDEADELTETIEDLPVRPPGSLPVRSRGERLEAAAVQDVEWFGEDDPTDQS